jgi:hypothetical protein
MKISEIAIPKKLVSTVKKTYANHLRGEYSNDIQNQLEKFGWNSPSSGCYSSVYINPKKDYVLKINGRPDPAFNHYVSLIHKFKNKHFPKISDMKKFKVSGYTYYVYFVEKLYKLSEKNKDMVFAVLADLGAEKALNYAGDIPQSKIDDFIRKNPEFVKAYKILSTNQRSYHSDLHDDNVMQRKDGTPVFSDPYSGAGSGSYSNHG